MSKVHLNPDFMLLGLYLFEKLRFYTFSSFSMDKIINIFFVLKNNYFNKL